jgi:hypothetical protein
MEVDNSNSLQQGLLDTICAWVKWCAGGSAALVECITGTVRDGGVWLAMDVKGQKPKLEINSDIAANGAAVVLVGFISPGTLLQSTNVDGHLSGAC